MSPSPDRRAGRGCERESAMNQRIVAVPAAVREQAHIDEATYRAWYEASLRDPDAFWGEHGRRIDWFRPYTQVGHASFGPGEVAIRWFEDGVTNVAHNCIDRHLATRGDQVAIIWEGDD